MKSQVVTGLTVPHLSLKQFARMVGWGLYWLIGGRFISRWGVCVPMDLSFELLYTPVLESDRRILRLHAKVWKRPSWRLEKYGVALCKGDRVLEIHFASRKLWEELRHLPAHRRVQESRTILVREFNSLRNHLQKREEEVIYALTNHGSLLEFFGAEVQEVPSGQFRFWQTHFRNHYVFAYLGLLRVLRDHKNVVRAAMPRLMRPRHTKSARHAKR
jgi:hypothetical protein